MSRLKYRNIELEIIHTREIHRRVVHSDDQTGYILTEWLFDVDCRYNPAATSYRAGVTPIQQTGIFPFETDEALRHYLSQPQGKLEYYNGGLVLRTPSLGYRTDARNGPIVESCNVVQVMGERQWLVNFRVRAFVNECPKAGTKNPLLSHRWTRHVEIDSEHFTSIVTEGKAIFRTDVLIDLGRFPDSYRQDLFHVVPPNCQRERIDVEASSDGSTIIYRIIDREKHYNFGSNCGAVRVEAYQTAWHSSPEPLPHLIDAFANGIPAAFAGGGNPGAVAAAGLNAGVRAGVRILPRHYNRVFCRAWGNRNSTREDLTSICTGIIARHLGPHLFKSQEVIVTHDLMGAFVEIDATVSWGPETFLAGAFAGGLRHLLTGDMASLAGWTSIWAQFNPDEEFSAGSLTLKRNPQVGNPAPPKSKGTRGTWVGALVHQVLSGSCETPPKPPAYEETENHTIP
jgi:hypothetical protein